MRTLNDETQARFGADATMLCTCWRITRTDGAELGFTDHDEDVVFGGTVFRAKAGAAPTALRQTAGLEADDAEFASVLDDEAITEADLGAGRYDQARVQLWRVDWTAPEARVLLRTGRIGEVQRAGAGYTAVFRSLKGALEGMAGRRYGRTCDAVVGDARCGLDLKAPDLHAAGTVVAASTDEVTIDVGLPRKGFFDGGVLTATDGALAGVPLSVRRAEPGPAGLALSLWRAAALAPGTGVVLTAGCDKRLETCRGFGNALNFRGHPHMPGNDVLTATPSPGGA